MSDCDKSLERKDLRKVVCRKKGVKRAKVKRKEKQGGETAFITCASFD